MNIQSILVSLISGGLFSAAWFILIDGIVQSHMDPSVPPFMWYYALPSVFVTFTNILMNLVERKQITSSSSMFGGGESDNKKSIAWFIFMLAGSICCIGGKKVFFFYFFLKKK
jgi:hypothetical protein